jgi:hypothetical protein
MTEQQYQKLILMELDEPDDGPVGRNIALLWDMFAGKTDPELRKLYVKRQALDVLIGTIWKGRVMQIGNVQSDKLDDKVKTLQSMRDTVQADIDRQFETGYINLDFLEPGGGDGW